MNVEEFNNLSDEQKAAFLSSVDSTAKQLEDITAERDSFKSENDSLKESAASTEKELKATKELNFTLARKVKTDPVDEETALYNFIKGVRQR